MRPSASSTGRIAFLSQKVPIGVAFFLFLVTIVFGAIGWSWHDKPDTFWDIVYFTLLAFSGDSLYHSVNSTALNIARISGVVTTGAALIGIIGLLFWEGVARLLACMRWDHTVMIGASDFGLETIGPSEGLTAIDREEALAALPRDRLPRRTLKIAQPVDPYTLKGRLLGWKPKRIVFADPDGITNVERVRLWMRERKKPNADKPGPEIVLRIDENLVARDLTLLSKDLGKARIVSRPAITARALVTAMAPTELAHLRGQAGVRVALVGLGSTNLAIAEELALRCHRPGQTPLQILVIDRNREEAEARLRAERPDLLNPDLAAEGFGIDFLELDGLECCTDAKAQALENAERAQPFTAISVAAGSDTENTAIAMRLRRLQRERLILKAPIFMRSDSMDSVAPPAFDDLTGGIVPFGGIRQSADDIALEERFEDLAKKLHEHWRASMGHDDTGEETWESKSNSDRRSSYRAALFGIEAFYAAGLVPPIRQHHAGMKAEPHAVDDIRKDTALMERLAELEHLRWNDERRLEGFQPPPDNGPRDEEKKRHNRIVPFERLDEANKEKDRTNIRVTLDRARSASPGAADPNVWRRVFRIGVLGPLWVDRADIERRLSDRLRDYFKSRAFFETADLEILTPNAPGFDREAAIAVAAAWRRHSGRACRILSLEAASVAEMNRLALPHAQRRAGDGVSEEEVEAVFKDQTGRLNQEAESGESNWVRRIDMRPLGVSDVELSTDPALYEASVEGVQKAVLRLADDMIFDLADGEATWTERARAAWTKTDPIVLTDPVDA